MGDGRDAVAATCAGNPHPPGRRRDREVGSARGERGAGGDAKGRRNRPPGARRRPHGMPCLHFPGGAEPDRRSARVPARRARRRGLGDRARLARDARQYRRERHAALVEAVPGGRLVEILGGNPFVGTIKQIGLFACLLETYDGLFHVRCSRRATISGRRILRKAIGEQRGVLVDPPPDVFIANLNAGAPQATCRFWAAHDEVATVQRAIIEAARQALADAGLHPTQLIRTIPADTDPSRLA